MVKSQDRQFLARDTMLAQHMLSSCESVRLSICSSHAGTVPKRASVIAENLELITCTERTAQRMILN